MKKKRKKLLKYFKEKFRSKFEARTFEYLSRLKDLTVSYEREKIRYLVHREALYTPDFLIKIKNGKSFYLETKGRFTSRDRKKHLDIKKQHPSLDIRFFFMQDNILYKGSKTKYSDWCKQYEFKYCIKEIPNEWFNITNTSY